MISERVRQGLTHTEVTILQNFGAGNEFVGRALGWAIVAHREQKRKSGELYIEHPIAVAKILKGWGLEQNELQAAALLHDTV